MFPPRPAASPPRPALRSWRHRLADGAATTVHALELAREHWTARVARVLPQAPLVEWCRANGGGPALIGGFYIRAAQVPLGELRIAGRRLRSVPFLAPWDRIRACVHTHGGELALRSRLELPAEPPGDLLQAGPMLARGGVRLIEPELDPEGFSAGAEQFDSDITRGRYPRAALGADEGRLIALVCDGRSPADAGLTLAELADLMIGLGAADAINLDGGGSASLVAGGELVNTPREEHGVRIPGGRPIATALRFEPR